MGYTAAANGAAEPELLSNHPEWQMEYEVVERVEKETDECVCVYFESGYACGFPPDHDVDIDPEQVFQ